MKAMLPEKTIFPLKTFIIRRCGFTPLKQLKTKRFLISLRSFGMTLWFVIGEEESSGAQSAPLLSSSRTHED